MQEIIPLPDRTLILPNRQKGVLTMAPIKPERKQQFYNQVVQEPYRITIEAFNALGIDTRDCPPLDYLIQEEIIPLEILRATFGMNQPELCIEPPLTRQRLRDLLEGRCWNALSRMRGQAQDFNNDLLWNDGASEITDGWKISIVDVVEEVRPNPFFYFINHHNDHDGVSSNGEAIRQWAAMYYHDGLDVMSGARSYLSVLIPKLLQGKTLDRVGLTVLNPKTAVVRGAEIALGYCSAGLLLKTARFDSAYSNLRVRSMLPVVGNF